MYSSFGNHFRSIDPLVICGVSVRKIFAKFIWKHLRWRPFQLSWMLKLLHKTPMNKIHKEIIWQYSRKIFAKFIWKHLRWRPFLVKLDA